MPTKASRKTAKKTPAHRSFIRSRDTQPFFVVRVTRQTLYWLILCGVVLLLGIWVLTLSIRIQNIYDQIDANESLIITSPPHKK